LDTVRSALSHAWNQPENQFYTDGATRVQRTLNEDFDQNGRLIQMLGTTTPRGLNNEGDTTYSMAYLDAVELDEQMPDEGETQIWEIYNLTGDTHPIHFHIVNVRVLGRAPFDTSGPNFAPVGDLRPPDANESGWKETVRMNPGEVTVVAMRFDLPKMPTKINNRFPVKVPTSPRFPGKKAYEYVWHCHILEHEEHDMMRPLLVRPKKP
jgi:spore coat protein A